MFPKSKNNIIFLAMAFALIIFCTYLGKVKAQIKVSSGLTISATVSSNDNTPPPPPSPQGTGGVSYTPPGNATVNFSGRAYPLSKVTILKDSSPIVTTIAGPDAKFSTSVSSLYAGNYNFSVYGEDSKGLRSDSFSFPLIITDNVSVDISGIFIAPTIGIDKTSVVKGDNLNIFGQSIPSSKVVISVHSNPETFHSVSTDKNGAYLYVLDTSSLENGTHTTKSKTVLVDSVSSYGKSINFTVGDKNDFIKNKICGASIGDLNCDKTVNIVDYSILAYWYNRPNPPLTVDLNHDGIIDLVDFSILAYYWTG